jgi:hypothetical protein
MRRLSVAFSSRDDWRAQEKHGMMSSSHNKAKEGILLLESRHVVIYY